jgi:hypothetical protein
MRVVGAAHRDGSPRSTIMSKIPKLLLLLAVLFAPTMPVHAFDGSGQGRLIIGQNFTLGPGQIVDGDLVVIGGTASIEYGGTVQGDIVIVGGSLRLDGQTTGNAVVIGGAAAVGPRASVGSDLITIGGNLHHETGAHIGGDVITNLPLPVISLPPIGSRAAPSVPLSSQLPYGAGALGRAVGVFLQSIGLAALAMLLTALLHPQLERVAQAAKAQPLMVGSVGLLVAVVAPLAVVILAITLILIPIALAAVILLVLAWLFGVVALGMLIGERLAMSVRGSVEPVISAGIGTFVLGLVVSTAHLVPCVGWLAPLLVGLLALGAAVVTMFGTRQMGPWSTAAAAAVDAAGRIPGGPAN